jgi:hypothetical protein
MEEGGVLFGGISGVEMGQRAVGITTFPFPCPKKDKKPSTKQEQKRKENVPGHLLSWQGHKSLW